MIFKAYPEEQRDMRWITVVLTTVATILLFFRITATIRNRGWLGLEDAFVVTANICLIILAACIYKSTTYGFGMRVVDIQRTGGNIPHAMKYFWLSMSFYTLTNGFNKMAFLALYYRVFPMKRFRQTCLAFGAISVAWTVGYLFVCIFQCNPLPRVYNRTIPGTCISFAWHRWSNAITNLITDIAIFILPMPVIFRLNMSLGNKIGLVVLFSMGFFICLTTALRMATLPLTLRTREPTYESAPTNLWSFIEAATGVICACLISLRKSISSLWPRKWRSSNAPSTGPYQHYGSGALSGHGLGSMRPRNGTGVGNEYAHVDLKSGGKSVSDPYGSVSPSESQERIIRGTKTGAVVTTSRSRSASASGSEDLVLQGIKVRTDVKVVRE